MRSDDVLHQSQCISPVTDLVLLLRIKVSQALALVCFVTAVVLLVINYVRCAKRGWPAAVMGDAAGTEVKISGKCDPADTEVETSGGSDDAGEKKKDDKDATK